MKNDGLKHQTRTLAQLQDVDFIENNLPKKKYIYLSLSALNVLKFTFNKQIIWKKYKIQNIEKSKYKNLFKNKKKKRQNVKRQSFDNLKNYPLNKKK